MPSAVKLSETLQGLHILHVWQSAYPWEVRVEKINESICRYGGATTVLCRRYGVGAKSGLVNKEVVAIEGKSRWKSLFSVPVPFNVYWTYRIFKEARQRHTTAIIVRDIPLALNAWLAARLLGVPVILDMAEHYPEAMRSWDKYRRSFILRFFVHTLRLPDILEQFLSVRMDHVFVVCEEQKRRLLDDLSVNPGQVTTVYNTPVEDQIPSPKDLAVTSVGKQSWHFGYHGILCEDRQLDVILRGFDIFAEGRRSARLTIAGSGESELSLRKIASSLKHREQIVFRGAFLPSERSRLYSEIDFGIVSLRDNLFTQNTLANKFFDYPAHAKPILYSRITPLETVMQTMRCGIGFVPGDPTSVAKAMEELCLADYHSLATSGRRAVEKEFNWGTDEKRLVQGILRAIRRD